MKKINQIGLFFGLLLSALLLNCGAVKEENIQPRLEDSIKAWINVKFYDRGKYVPVDFYDLLVMTNKDSLISLRHFVKGDIRAFKLQHINPPKKLYSKLDSLNVEIEMVEEVPLTYMLGHTFKLIRKDEEEKINIMFHFNLDCKIIKIEDDFREGEYIVPIKEQ